MLLESIILAGIIGVIIGFVLAIVEKVFAVKSDERYEAILSVLPGINCGACGFPGCSGYAQSLAQGKSEPNFCSVGGISVAQKISEIIGVELKQVEKRVAVLHCQGGRSKSVEKFNYKGISSCSAVNIIDGGNKACSYGCLGLGDCILVCQFDALKMGSDKLPIVDKEKCTACGKCVQTCPRGLFELIPISRTPVVLCKSKENGPDTRKNCKIGCVACRICEKKCPVSAIKVIDNLAVIDYSICTSCGICVEVCPQKVIVNVAPKNKE